MYNDHNIRKISQLKKPPPQKKKKKDTYTTTAKIPISVAGRSVAETLP